MNGPKVAVVGGGPAGAVTAYALSKAGAEVTLVHWGGPTGGHGAPQTLSPEGKGLLVARGLWTDAPPGVLAPCTGIRRSWNSEPQVRTSFFGNPYGQAWHLDRALFDTWLLRRAEDVGTCITRARFSGAQWERGRWRMWCSNAGDERQLAADFLVDASGSSSVVARHLGIRRRKLDRTCVLLASPKEKCGETPDDDLLIEATPVGWWYSVSRAGGSRPISLVTDGEMLPRDEAGRLAFFARALEAAPSTSMRVGQIGSVRFISSPTSRLDTMVGDAWLAVGDAATTRDILSGTGVSEALRSGFRAAGAIIEAARSDASALTRFGRDVAASAELHFAARTSAYSARHAWRTPYWEGRRLNASMGGEVG